MAKLTPMARAKIPANKFASPGKIFPVVTPAQKKTVVADAETVLHRGKKLPGYS
jgi:hypothetical protein